MAVRVLAPQRIRPCARVDGAPVDRAAVRVLGEIWGRPPRGSGRVLVREVEVVPAVEIASQLP